MHRPKLSMLRKSTRYMTFGVALLTLLSYMVLFHTPLPFYLLRYFYAPKGLLLEKISGRLVSHVKFQEAVLLNKFVLKNFNFYFLNFLKFRSLSYQFPHLTTSLTLKNFQANWSNFKDMTYGREFIIDEIKLKELGLTAKDPFLAIDAFLKKVKAMDESVSEVFQDKNVIKLIWIKKLRIENIFLNVGFREFNNPVYPLGSVEIKDLKILVSDRKFHFSHLKLNGPYLDVLIDPRTKDENFISRIFTTYVSGKFYPKQDHTSPLFIDGQIVFKDGRPQSKGIKVGDKLMLGYKNHQLIFNFSGLDPNVFLEEESPITQITSEIKVGNVSEVTAGKMTVANYDFNIQPGPIRFLENSPNAVMTYLFRASADIKGDIHDIFLTTYTSPGLQSDADNQKKQHFLVLRSRTDLFQLIANLYYRMNYEQLDHGQQQEVDAKLPYFKMHLMDLDQNKTNLKSAVEAE
jgi:hypothetical protein